jgi:hypothetical protein
MQPTGTAWSAALVAWIAAVPLWRFTRYTITIAHEGGHTLLGVLLGAGVGRVTVDRGGGGGTQFRNRMPWLVDLVVTLGGYLGPSAVGLGGVALLLHGRPYWVLWCSLGLLALIVLKVRTLVGVAAVVGTGALLFWVARHGSEAVVTGFAHGWVWFLLIGGVRQISTLFQVTRAGDPTSDVAVLSRLTWLPGVIWLGVFWAGTMVALVWGGALLLRR